MRLPAEWRICHDDIKQTLLYLPSRVFVLPFPRRSKRIPLKHVGGSVPMHDKVHLGCSDKEWV